MGRARYGVVTAGAFRKQRAGRPCPIVADREATWWVGLERVARGQHGGMRVTRLRSSRITLCVIRATLLRFIQATTLSASTWIRYNQTALKNLKI